MKTPITHFSAPESIKGELDEKSDIWSLGVILYFMICKNLPFIALNE